ncbi:hypothetical protein [Paraburkholderia megapolitana]|uniref:hypothetical protein n=1 Tax=Paraburkholderia megapolitana TaxID=420953 RepID=UPI0038BBD2D0
MTTRKYRILTRYNAAPINEFLYYARGIPMDHLCRMLNRHPRTISRWTHGHAVIPPWAVATLRLQTLEYQIMRDQMGYTALEREYESKREAQRPPAIPLKHRTPAANEAVYEPRTRHQLPLPGFPHQQPR